MCRYISVIGCFILSVVGPLAMAQQVLTLDDCHRLALESNSQIKILDEKRQSAEDMRKLALTEFFPRVSANGLYHWSSRNVEILSDDQKTRLSTLGDQATALVGKSLSTRAGKWVWDNAMAQASTKMAAGMNEMGQQFVNDFEIDTRNVFVGAVTVTQPIYLGGKIREAYRIAQLNAELSGLTYDVQQEALLVSIDEAYWRVVSLEHKVQLAEQYVKLLEDLSADVDAMVEAEVATRADQMKVRVKLNEARMSQTKASNGLALSKMLLFQLCGLDLDGDYVVAEDSSLVRYTAYDSINMQEVWGQRSELKMLNIAEQMASSSVRLASSAFLPNIAATGSYLISNPSFFNGVSNKTDGMFTVGIVANIPICHPDAFYAVRVAKHKRNEVRMQIAEAREKIELQVNKINYELDVANKKYVQAESNLVNAEENLRLATESFEAGVLNSSDLLAAQTAWLSAKGDVLDADIEIRLAYRLLRQAMGL
ncbi:MAG: TolC family protein [Bacteroidales bacterium]|nr:TolC family protein [Bacteroidales bacterium]